MGKDVIVIGAGASVPYGFPTGDILLQNIRAKDILAVPPGILKEWHDVWYPDNDVELESFQQHLLDQYASKINNEIMEPLRNSCILSIDQFLKNHLDNKRLQKVVKSLIALEILEAEYKALIGRSNSIGGFSNDNEMGVQRHLGKADWIQHLLTRMDLACPEVSDLPAFFANTTFISFNYDRVLEYFLDKYFIYDRGMSEGDARKLLSNLNIYHINGYLGSLDDVGFGDKDVEYLKVVENMRTVWEIPSTDHEDLSEKAKLSIRQADRIFVLGTSYIKENNSSIGLHQSQLKTEYRYRYASVRGTGFGLSKAAIFRSIKNMGLLYFETDRAYVMAEEDEWPIKNITACDLIIDEY